LSNTNLSIEQQLLESRRWLQGEIKAALACRTKKSKIALVDRWKSQYSPITVKELLNVARNKSAAGDIIHWELGDTNDINSSRGNGNLWKRGARKVR
jgi:hypothetical protein